MQALRHLSTKHSMRLYNDLGYMCQFSAKKQYTTISLHLRTHVVEIDINRLGKTQAFTHVNVVNSYLKYCRKYPATECLKSFKLQTKLLVRKHLLENRSTP